MLPNFRRNFIKIEKDLSLFELVSGMGEMINRLTLFYKDTLLGS